MRYITLFSFVVVSGISSVAEGQEDGGGAGAPRGEMCVYPVVNFEVLFM